MRRPGLSFCIPVVLAAGGMLVPVRSACAQQDGWQQSMAAGEQALEARRYERAEEFFQAALEQAGNLSENDPRKVETLLRLARVYQLQGDFAKPETLYEEALKLAEKAFGAEDPGFARCLNEVGRYFHIRRKYDQTEQYYKNAFATRVRTLGREHPDVAESILNLAILYENLGLLDKAEVYYEHALAIREKALGPDHLDTIATLEHFARLLYKIRRGGDAQKMQDRALAARVKRVQELGSDGTGSDFGEVYQASDGLTAPRLVDKVEPEYTEEARIARHEGSVVLGVDIGPDGRAHNFQLIRSLGLGLDERAVEAVKQWRFKPARKGGKPVAFRATMEIHFRLL